MQNMSICRRLTFYDFHSDRDHISASFQNTFVNHTKISCKMDDLWQITLNICNKTHVTKHADLHNETKISSY